MEKKIDDISYRAPRDAKPLPRPYRCIYIYMKGKKKTDVYIYDISYVLRDAQNHYLDHTGTKKI